MSNWWTWQGGDSEERNRRIAVNAGLLTFLIGTVNSIFQAPANLSNAAGGNDWTDDYEPILQIPETDFEKTAWARDPVAARVGYWTPQVAALIGSAPLKAPSAESLSAGAERFLNSRFVQEGAKLSAGTRFTAAVEQNPLQFPKVAGKVVRTDAAIGLPSTTSKPVDMGELYRFELGRIDHVPTVKVARPAAATAGDTSGVGISRKDVSGRAAATDANNGAEAMRGVNVRQSELPQAPTPAVRPRGSNYIPPVAVPQQQQQQQTQGVQNMARGGLLVDTLRGLGRGVAQGMGLSLSNVPDFFTVNVHGVHAGSTQGSIAGYKTGAYNFSAIICSPTKRDIETIDSFFTAYGYRVDRFMTPKIDFGQNKGGKNCFYLKTGDSCCKSSVREAQIQLDAMCQAGTRFWQNEIGA